MIGSASGPNEGECAGSDSDIHDEYLRQQVHEYRSDAKQKINLAKKLLGSQRGQAEAYARAALEDAAKAFWWADEGPLEQSQHDLMHQLGRWTRKNFGCSLQFVGEQYRTNCPVRIAHTRIGLSIGGSTQMECSICGEDLSICPHIKGRSYWIRGGPWTGGNCRVCFKPVCNHRDDRLYRAPVVAIIVDGNIDEVSEVRRPANPTARMIDIPLSTEKLAELLGTDFHPGVDLSCDMCLEECTGFVDPFTDDDDGNESSIHHEGGIT